MKANCYVVLIAILAGYLFNICSVFAGIAVMGYYQLMKKLNCYH